MLLSVCFFCSHSSRVRALLMPLLIFYKAAEVSGWDCIDAGTALLTSSSCSLSCSMWLASVAELEPG